VITGLPVVDAFAPLWALSLPGTGFLVRLDAQSSPMLDAVCDALEIRTTVFTALVSTFDEADPSRVAALLRSAIETAGAA
jgi:hypothetical protein